MVLITEQDVSYYALAHETIAVTHLPQSLYYNMMTEYIRPNLQNVGRNLIYSRSIRTGQ